MPNTEYRSLNRDLPPTTSVERACQITRNLFNAARGQHATDSETVQTIARRAQLSPAAVRRFLQPSRHPKDVSLGVWTKLFGAYRRYLRQRIADLEAEIVRLEHMDPDDGAIQALLDEAKGLVCEIEAAQGAIPAGRGRPRGSQQF